MRFLRFHLHPGLLLCLLVLWGAGSLYLFSTGIAELLQTDHEMTEALARGRMVAVREQAAAVRLHVTWRLVLGAALLGLAMGLFRRRHRG
ncbi:hypothetical protein [Prosthecobacter sp.]|uniref:hypothetical protein n=1 Tax=Prosthecobacter sp. TaxID=1965333 RepID=UPI0037838DF6